MNLQVLPPIAKILLPRQDEIKLNFQNGIAITTPDQVTAYLKIDAATLKPIDIQSDGPETTVTIGTPVARDLGADVYEGPYEAIPKAHAETIFQTKNKLLIDNVYVREVPYWETSNQSGITAYIASEVN